MHAEVQGLQGNEALNQRLKAGRTTCHTVCWGCATPVSPRARGAPRRKVLLTSHVESAERGEGERR